MNKKMMNTKFGSEVTRSLISRINSGTETGTVKDVNAFSPKSYLIVDIEWDHNGFERRASGREDWIDNGIEKYANSVSIGDYSSPSEISIVYLDHQKKECLSK